jgi:hypothetical protein
MQDLITTGLGMKRGPTCCARKTGQQGECLRLAEDKIRAEGRNNYRSGQRVIDPYEMSNLCKDAVERLCVAFVEHQGREWTTNEIK